MYTHTPVLALKSCSYHDCYTAVIHTLNVYYNPSETVCIPSLQTTAFAYPELNKHFLLYYNMKLSTFILDLPVLLSL